MQNRLVDSIPAIILASLLIGVLSFNGCEKEQKYANPTFSKTFGYDYKDVGESVQETRDGGFIIIGTTNSYETLSDIWLIKTDSEGEEEWSQVYGGAGFDEGYAVDQTSDGGFIIGGYTSSIGNGLKDAWVIKTNSLGAVEWEITYGNSKDDCCYDIRQSTDGGYIICGTTTLQNNNLCDILVVKIDSVGTIMWDSSIGDNDSADQGFSVTETSSGDFVIVGYSSPGINGFSDIRLFKMSTSGTLIWDKIYGGDDYDEGYAVCETTGGGLIITATMESYGNGLDDGCLIKTDSTGVTEWQQILGGAGRDIANDITINADGDFLMVGSTNSFGNGYYDNWIIKTNAEGNLVWEQIYGDDLDDGGKAISPTSDGGYIITGYTYSYGSGNCDLWLLKIDSLGFY